MKTKTDMKIVNGMIQITKVILNIFQNMIHPKMKSMKMMFLNNNINNYLKEKLKEN